MRNIWKEFNKLHTLSIQYANSALRQASIYANGHNQVHILVTVKVSGLDNKPLQITQQDLQQALYLCDYHTGNRLSAPWIISFVENAYNQALSYRPISADEPAPTPEHGQDHNANLSFYLSCEPQCHGGLIAIALDVPGVGVFNTTESGTDTKNGPAGAGNRRFVHPLYISVTPVPAIDYSDPAHMQMEVGEEETLTNTW